MSSDSRFFRRLRWFAVLVAICIVVKYLVFTEGQMLGRPHLDPPRLAALLGLVLWWVGPELLCAWLVRSKFWSVVMFALLIPTVLILRATYGTGSSTAGLGLIFGPIYIYPAAVVIVVIDRGVLAFKKHIVPIIRAEG